MKLLLAFLYVASLGLLGVRIAHDSSIIAEIRFVLCAYTQGSNPPDRQSAAYPRPVRVASGHHRTTHPTPWILQWWPSRWLVNPIGTTQSCTAPIRHRQPIMPPNRLHPSIHPTRILGKRRRPDWAAYRYIFWFLVHGGRRERTDEKR
uniref:Secreted protein n=1 Tax=Mycena chlorophos TaxID=658473 RepID=A0ABQ0LTL2_MYCCL|nr:predicted protein [Mycena chlorophos]